MRRFFRATSANMSILAMGVMAAVALIAGGAIDYASLANQKHSLQDIADGAALAAAREMVVVRATNDRVQSIAETFVAANAVANAYGSAVETKAALEPDGHSVTVTLSADPRVFFPGPIAMNAGRVQANATAEVSGGGNVCMIGLDTAETKTIDLKDSARLTASDCAIYSNSASKQSLTVKNTARVHASLICVAGGLDGVKSAIIPEPVEDCPPLDDPLKDRPPPPFSPTACDYTDLKIDADRNLTPGVYCGGIDIKGGVVTLARGVYIIKDGPLEVKAGSLIGQGVGFFLTGNRSVVGFEPASRIDLSGPTSGPLGGLLFSEDRTTVFDADHSFRSDDARRLEGTLYFPRSKLLIEAKRPIADRSDYTVIIARAFELRDGPELVLRTNYSASPVPVPEGVGNRSASTIRLIE